MFLQYFSVIQKYQLKDESDAERVGLFLLKVRLKDFLCVSVCVGVSVTAEFVFVLQQSRITNAHRASAGLFNRLTML